MAGRETNEEEPLYIGIDLSTQQLKIITCFENLSIHSKYSVNFEHFKTEYPNLQNGTITDELGMTVTPIFLLIDSIQYLFDLMKLDNFPFCRVKSIGGSCQQHGTVFYTSEIDNLLSNLNNELSTSIKWSDYLKNGFSFKNASNWQDKSTFNEVEDFEHALGDKFKLCEITGSKAHYRFSGLQIRKRCKIGNADWVNTDKINLISSFLMTLLTGKFQGIENSEACGMNLFDIERNDWNDELLSLILLKNCKIDNVSKTEELKAATKAREMFGNVLSSDDYSLVSKLLVRKYGFPSNCKVRPITGDNMGTIMSLPLKSNDILISLGTSTTVLLLTEKYSPSINYHLFKHPVKSNLYMGMLCYCNGALAREKIKDSVNSKYGINNGKWDKFNEILEDDSLDKSVENDIGIYFPNGEIIPNVKACTKRFHFDESGKIHEYKEESEQDVEKDVKLIIESQALSCRLRVCPLLTYEKDNDVNYTGKVKELKGISEKILKSEKITIDKVDYSITELLKRPNNVYYVGGGSQNESIVKKYNRVMAPLQMGYQVKISDACALGGSFRAAWGSEQESGDFSEWLGGKFDEHWGELRGVPRPEPETEPEPECAVSGCGAQGQFLAGKTVLLSVAEGKCDIGE